MKKQKEKSKKHDHTSSDISCSTTPTASIKNKPSAPLSKAAKAALERIDDINKRKSEEEAAAARIQQEIQ